MKILLIIFLLTNYNSYSQDIPIKTVKKVSKECFKICRILSIGTRPNISKDSPLQIVSVQNELNDLSCGFSYGINRNIVGGMSDPNRYYLTPVIVISNLENAILSHKIDTTELI